MKNLIKKKIISAIENWPSRKPCVKESLGGLVGSTTQQTTYEEPPCIAGCGEGMGVGTAFAMVRSAVLPHAHFAQSCRGRAPDVTARFMQGSALSISCSSSHRRHDTKTILNGKLLQGGHLQGPASRSCTRRQGCQSRPLHQRKIPGAGLLVPGLPLLPHLPPAPRRLCALLHPRQQLHEPQRGLSHSDVHRRRALPARRETLHHAVIKL